MLAREITSLQHPIAKYLVKLREERAFRAAEKRVLVMGDKLVAEISAHTPIQMLFARAGTSSSIQAKETCYVSDALLKKITGLDQPESLAAVVPLPPSQSLAKKKFLVALDAVADPGNMGTILRSALALGWEGVFITTNSTDPFNAKAMRASQGAVFHLPLCFGTHEELNTLIADNHLHVLIGDTKGKNVGKEMFSPPLILVLGNETHGPRFVPASPFESVTIPMNTNVESLNVASAAAILMYALKRP